MQIDEIIIRNYKNFKDFKINLANFNLIVGENNIGKTNLVEAIEGVLNPTRYYKQFYIEETDFIDLNEPVEIIIKFGNLTDNDKENLEPEIIDPVNNTTTIRFTAEWNGGNKSIEKNCGIMPSFDGTTMSRYSDFSSDIKRHFQYYLIPCVRNAKESIKSKRTGDLNKILELFLPNFRISINSLKKEIVKDFNILLEELNDFEYFKELIESITTEFNRFQELPSIFKEEVKVTFVSIFNNIKIFENSAHETLSTNIDDIPVGLIEEVKWIFRNIIEKLGIFEKRLENHLLLNKLRAIYDELKGIKKLNREFKNIIKLFMPSINLELSFLSISDNELFKEAIIKMDSFSLFDQGTGYQSYFVIALKLLKIKSILDELNAKSVLLAIEEPEVHLHPHLQRQLIENLKIIQEEFKEQYEIEIQFILTSHSSNIISKINYNELQILRKNQSGFTECKKVPKDILERLIDDILGSRKNESEMRKKKRRSLINTLDKIFSFYPEIFFSKLVIIGEGVTEEGAIPIFATILEKSFDSIGITYVNSEGDGNIDYYAKILNIFSIPYLYLKDRDKGEDITGLREEYVTDRKAFEAEILETIPLYKILDVCTELCGDDTINNLCNEIKSREPSFAPLGDVDEVLEHFRNNPSLFMNLKPYFKRFLVNRKGLMLGRLIANRCKKDEIPNVYRKIIMDATKFIERGGLSG